jgi:hypothetical protein
MLGRLFRRVYLQWKVNREDGVRALVSDIMMILVFTLLTMEFLFFMAGLLSMFRAPVPDQGGGQRLVILFLLLGAAAIPPLAGWRGTKKYDAAMGRLERGEQ